MERNNNCSLECLLHRLVLTFPALSNHGACIRWCSKGSAHRFHLSKNTLVTKPSWSWSTLMAPVLVLDYKQEPKQNTPKAPCPQPAIQIAKAKTLGIKIESFIFISDEDNCFPSPSALRILCMGRMPILMPFAQMQRHWKMQDRENEGKVLISGSWHQQNDKAEATKCQMKQTSSSCTIEGRKIPAEFPQWFSLHVVIRGVSPLHS